MCMFVYVCVFVVVRGFECVCVILRVGFLRIYVWLCVWFCVCVGVCCGLWYVCFFVGLCLCVFLICACDIQVFGRTDRIISIWTVGGNWTDWRRNLCNGSLTTGAAHQPVSRLLVGQETYYGEMNNLHEICIWKTWMDVPCWDI